MTLELRGLSIGDANRTLVFDIDLTIAPGSVTAVLGSNGAGKSELVLGLAGILPVRSGQVLLDGRRIDGTGPEAIRRAGLAAVPEGHRVLTDLSVDDNLRAAGLLLGRDMPARLDEVYAIFPELAQRKAQLAGTLSGGQQQMVALGHALMCRPRYLLLDEMSLGLAPLIVRRLLGVVSSLKAEGVGILLIEQFTDLALGMAETALVLRGGRVRYTGPASTLSQDKDLLHTAYFGL